MTGQFGTVRTTGFVATMIRLMTRSQVNHAFVFVGDGQIVEAMGRGAQVTSAHKYDGHLVATSQLRLTIEEAERVAHAARSMEGTPYGFLDIAALFFLLLGFRWGWLLRRAQTSNSLICSQLVDRAYAKAGVHLYDDNRPDGQVTPGDLLLYIALRSQPHE